jgi:hypothetical protein
VYVLGMVPTGEIDRRQCQWATLELSSLPALNHVPWLPLQGVKLTLVNDCDGIGWDLGYGRSAEEVAATARLVAEAATILAGCLIKPYPEEFFKLAWGEVPSSSLASSTADVLKAMAPLAQFLKYTCLSLSSWELDDVHIQALVDFLPVRDIWLESGSLTSRAWVVMHKLSDVDLEEDLDEHQSLELYLGISVPQPIQDIVAFSSTVKRAVTIRKMFDSSTAAGLKAMEALRASFLAVAAHRSAIGLPPSILSACSIYNMF